MNRRELIAGLGALAMGAAVSPEAAAGGWPVYGIQRGLSMEMAKAYQLRDRKRQIQLFKDLFDVQSTFKTVNAWPSTALVVSDAMSALSRVLSGESIDRAGYRKVERRTGGPFVVFSDHHIVPPENRQKKVWLQNRDAYAKLIRHYAGKGYTIIENGDVEDLVILEPKRTEAVYRKVLAQHSKKKKGIDTKRLLSWFREHPNEMRDVLTTTRSEWRQYRSSTRSSTTRATSPTTTHSPRSRRRTGSYASQGTTTTRCSISRCASRGWCRFTSSSSATATTTPSCTATSSTRRPTPPSRRSTAR